MEENIEQEFEAEDNRIVYIDGNDSEISINVEKSEEVLEVLHKVMDSELRTGNFNYEQRKKLIKLSKGRITTYQAFTKSSWVLDPNVEKEKYGELEDYLDDSSNWLDERNELHNELVHKYFRQVRRLSDKLQQTGFGPTFFALRGNNGAGKSTALRDGYFIDVSLSREDIGGTINADIYKRELRLGKISDTASTDVIPDLSHGQVHIESTRIENKIRNNLYREPELSAIFDKRFAWTDQVNEIVLAAMLTDRPLRILDIDISLETSAVRVLLRNPNDDDPVVNFDVISKGFQNIRNNRRELRRYVNKKAIIHYYLLADFSDGRREIASKRSKDDKVVVFPDVKYLELRRLLGQVTVEDLELIYDLPFDDPRVKKVLDIMGENDRNKIEKLIATYAPRKMTLGSLVDVYSEKMKNR